MLSVYVEITHTRQLVDFIHDADKANGNKSKVFAVAVHVPTGSKCGQNETFASHPIHRCKYRRIEHSEFGKCGIHCKIPDDRFRERIVRIISNVSMHGPNLYDHNRYHFST